VQAVSIFPALLTHRLEDQKQRLVRAQFGGKPERPERHKHLTDMLRSQKIQSSSHIDDWMNESYL